MMIEESKCFAVKKNHLNIKENNNIGNERQELLSTT